MVLLIVTVFSLVVAAAAGAFALRAHRREAARADARVAALAAAIDGDTLPESGGWIALDDFDAQTAPRLVPTTEPDRTGPGAMFSMDAGASDAGRQLTPVLALAAAASLVVIGTVLWNTSGSEVANAKTPPPIELLSLRNDRDVNGLAIKGLVRNPAGAPPLTGVTATVFVFDGQGSFLASSRAPLDFTTLSAGEESPFTVTLSPAPAGAARYRVSFRKEDSGVVQHLDRRKD